MLAERPLNNILEGLWGTGIKKKLSLIILKGALPCLAAGWGIILFISSKVPEDFTKAKEKDGYNSEAYRNRGNTYKFIDAYEKAAKDFVMTKSLDQERQKQWT